MMGRLQQSRIDYIDLLRSFGIIMMIMGHVAFGSLFDKWIHIFHMPMFFVISGFFYRILPFGAMIKRKARTLLIPYIVFGTLHCIIYFGMIGHIDSDAIISLVWDNTSGEGIPIAGALWFLTAMFFSELIFWGVNALRVKQVWKYFISGIIAVIGMMCATYLPVNLPLALDAGMVGVGFYQIGKIIKDRFPKVINANGIVGIIGVVGFSAIGLINDYVNMRQGSYGNWLLFWISSIGMTISLWNLSRIISPYLSRNSLTNKLMDYLKCIGKDSIIYLCFNQLMILICTSIVSIVFPVGVSGFILLIKKTIILLCTIVLLDGIRIVSLHTKLRQMIGR